MSRIRAGGGRRQQARVGAPDPALTPNAGLAAISELCGRLGVISALDAAVGPIKQRDRGFGAGQQLAPVPGLSSTTAAGLARRVIPRQWQAVETGLAAVTSRMLALLPAPRAAALTEGPVTIDLDTTDVEVYGRKKRGVAYNREEQAHHSLGTAEGITREFTARKEEDRLVKDLLAGKTVDQSIEAANAVDDFLADLLAGVGDQPGGAEPPRADVPELFISTEAFAREALDFACPALHVDDDGEMLAFAPPDDLVQRLAVLPPNYLKKHNVAERMKVTLDRKLAQRKLDEARKTKTLWPDIAYLSDLHPMIEWLTDKVLLRITRQQAPVLIADVTEPVFLVQGVYSNALGQPTVVRWMAVSGLPDEPRVDGLTDTLRQAGVGPGMVNTLGFGDIDRLQELVPAAVRAARAHLEERRGRPGTGTSWWTRRRT